MVRAMALRLPLGLCLAGGASAFVPFAGVEELKPQPLHQYCGQASFPSQDGKSNLRRCQHSVRKTLEDGGEVELSWRMHADPDRLLSLDTEAEKGVRLRRCRPDELELDLPESHARHAAEGHIVVGSRFVHSCGHLSDRHMYHRVLGVRQHEWHERGAGQPRVARVRLATEELSSFNHAVEEISFSFSYMPVEARDYVPFPQMRTDFGLNRPAPQPGTAPERRLFKFPKAHLPKTLKKMMHIHTVEDDAQDMQVGNTLGQEPDGKSGLLHFVPKQVSNFGWNWNFAMNTTQEPVINISMPGAKGIIEVHKPFIKIHAGFYLNFTSKFGGLIKAPKVFWKAGIDGHGHVQARILTMLNTTSSAGVDPFKVFNYPTLQQLERPRWFHKIHFATGMVPISFEPGFQFNTQMYHAGTFDGAVSFGGRTHGVIRPTLTFDSLKGFDADFKGVLLDTEIWPPLWMVFTRHFEFGVTFVPSILMRGDFLGFEKATTAIEMMPYMNITITREGRHAKYAGETKSLTAYPLRIMGLPSGGLQKTYKVRVQANDLEVETAPEANWGEVQFHEHVSKFDMGKVPVSYLKEQPIAVTLLEVEEGSGDPIGTVLGSGSVRCQRFANGECTPTPTVARIQAQDGSDVAAVQLVVLWDDDPKPLLASKIHGLGVAVAQLAVRPGGINTSQPLSAQLIQGGLTYSAALHRSAGAPSTSFGGETTFEFRPAFVDSWKPCALNGDQGLKCESPRLELFAGSKRVAVADFPQQHWTAATSSAAAGGSGTHVPAVVPLASPGNATDFLAVLKVNVTVSSPAVASSFLQPRSAQQATPTEVATLTWTIRDVARERTYDFNLMAFKFTEVPAEQAAQFVSYPKVGTAALVPVLSSAESVALKCQQVAMMGLPAEEAPCSFSHGIDFGRFKPAVGDRLTFLLQWSQGGGKYVMYSPPFEVSNATRRLQELPTAAPMQELPNAAPTRHPWTKEAWNNQISKHAKSCEKRDLHFNLGAGILMRGRLKNAGLLKGLNMMGGHLEAPELSTGYRRIAAIKPGTDAQDLFPDTLCQDGLCEGALPGCSQGNQKKRFYPRLIFNMNRPYHFSNMTKGKFHGLMKRAMAYAFSAMPMMLNVAIKEVKENGGLFGKKRTPEAVGPEAWANHGSSSDALPFGGMLDRSTTPQPSVHVSAGALTGWDTSGTGSGSQGAAPAPAPAPAPAFDPAGRSNSNVFNQWYTRRLSSTGKDRGEEALEPHQVALSFREGLHFDIDRPLVELMLKHGFFQGVEDDASKDLGPLRVTSFFIAERSESPAPDAEPSVASRPLRGRAGLPGRSTASLRGLAALAGAAAAGMAALAAVRRRWQRSRSEACSLQRALDLHPAE
uniref:Uncharacterized protein n=1 Tax=Alexandrium monilatum TaxID=311494 RepID=A0A7S4QVJ4_9DINO